MLFDRGGPVVEVIVETLDHSIARLPFRCGRGPAQIAQPDRCLDYLATTAGDLPLEDMLAGMLADIIVKEGDGDVVPEMDFQKQAEDGQKILDPRQMNLVEAAGLRHRAKNGITTFHNMDGNFYQLELPSELQDEGHLLCRGQIPFHLKNFDSVDRLQEADEMCRRGNSDWL